MATLHLVKSATVSSLKKQFHDEFGSQLRVYDGNNVANPSDYLGSIGFTANGDLECRSSLTVGSFIERMKNDFGLKVKVYTADDWVAVLDGLTLASSGKVKKQAKKADMEDMIAYQKNQ